MPRGGQLARQWRLLQLIDRPAGIAVDDAARELGCAVRTIWRDLQVLHRGGLPVYDDPMADGRRSVWRVDDAFRRQLPLKLTLSETVALLMSRHLLGPAGAGVLGPAVASAFDKVARVLSKEALDLIARLRDAVGVRTLGAKLQAPAAEHLSTIQTALTEHRQLRLRYYSMSRDETITRRVDPYHLTLFEGGFYLVAHCHLRGDVRIFAVERIRECALLAMRFAVPSTFDAAKYLAGAWGMIRGDAVTVRVVFASPLARYIRDRLWHPTQKCRTLHDGRLEMTLHVADTLEVRRWILGFGSEAEVVEPPALRDALRREAEALARKLAPRRIPPEHVLPWPAEAHPRPSRSARSVS
ncbi:MAG TPA: WYL domain-containing protein [Candidatus Methylomirabilis sp.]|nr:WYL domain-containing protein [Candidatus Methylomirabilis sp.]